MINTIFIMPNKSTSPDATMMIVVDEVDPPTDPKTYQYVYVGNINNLPSDVLTEGSIVNDLTTGGTNKPLSAEQGRTLNSHVNYTTCGSNAGDQVKLISDDGFELSTHLRLLVKMNNTNTHATPKFNINNTGVKDVWYNGSVASDTNTWSAGEVLDVYYDGTKYITNTHGGAQFSTGEKVGDVGIDEEPTAGSENLVKSGGVKGVTRSINNKLVDFENVIQNFDGDGLYISDGRGNVVAKITSEGIESIEVKAGNNKLSELPSNRGIDGIIPDSYEGELYITDKNGYVVAKFDEDGLNVIKLVAKQISLVENLLPNHWNNKVIATYGDSITACNNGDYIKPINVVNYNWANEVANYFSMLKQYGRGIGSTCFMWRQNGGQVAWVNTNTGEYVGRDDNYNYDNYEGHVTIPIGCTAIRGDGSSWLRITSMFPAAIKDTIDVVLLMFHNDFHQDMDTDVAWIPNNTTDTEWAASSYYSTLGGDYNISTVKGGIASTVMKFQAWMPNALLILMTPISGVHATASALDGNFDNTEAAKMRKLANAVKDVAFRMSIPCIDNYGNDGINSLNRTQFITDTIHPYSVAGRKMIARNIISAMLSIIPRL